MRKTWWGLFLFVIPLTFSYGEKVAEGRMRGSTSEPPLTPTLSQGERGTKYNPQFGTAWQLALKQKAPQRWLDCVIRVKTPPTSDEIAQLKATGFQPRSIIHDIITGRIQARHVSRFLKLPFVVSVEGGGMGGPKGTRGLK